jgi:hypothetical protein
MLDFSALVTAAPSSDAESKASSDAAPVLSSSLPPRPRSVSPTAVLSVADASPLAPSAPAVPSLAVGGSFPVIASPP